MKCRRGEYFDARPRQSGSCARRDHISIRLGISGHHGNSERQSWGQESVAIAGSDPTGPFGAQGPPFRLAD
jgi:hypothetical protein